MLEIFEIDCLPLLSLHFVLRFVEKQLVHFLVFANSENIDIIDQLRNLLLHLALHFTGQQIQQFLIIIDDSLVSLRYHGSDLLPIHVVNLVLLAFLINQQLIIV
jgi:hypothetical protein